MWINLDPATNNEQSLQGRLFSLEPIFQDGFEAGDTSKWTVTVD